MSKRKADNLTKLDTRTLKKYGYFAHGYRSGIITWTRSDAWGENANRIEIATSISEDTSKARLTYTISKENGEKINIDYDVPLTTTPCHYGKNRYWFICPLSRNGIYCGRRVGALYMDGDYFGCRHCYDLTYRSKNISRHSKYFSLFNIIEIEDQIEKLQAIIKRSFYAGRPTKKNERLERLHRRVGMHYRRYFGKAR